MADGLWKGGIFMLKKAIPLFMLSALMLGGCNMNDAVPNENETPMEDTQDRERNWTPNVNDNQRGGSDIDGIDNGQERNGNGVNNGFINGDNGDDNGVMDEGKNKTPNESIIEENNDGM